MANRYWVGGTALWDNTAGTKWALTSGGSGGEAVPTSSDDVYFDAASGSVTIGVDRTVSCKNLTFTGFTGTFDNYTIIQVYGNVVLGSGGTYTWSGNIDFYGESVTQTITFNGKTLGGYFSIQYDTCTVSLQDEARFENMGNWLNGTLTTNNNNVYLTDIQASSGDTKVFNMGSSTIFITAGSWNVNATSLTINAGTSTIKFTNTANTARTFNGQGKTYNNLWFDRGTSTAINTIVGSNTFAEFKDTGTAAHTIKFTDGTDTTVTSLVINGSSGKLITLTGTSTGGWTISDSTGTNTVTYCNISYSTAEGGATFTATNSTDGGNNSGWSFGSTANTTNFFNFI